MKKLVAQIELITDDAVRCANVNFDDVHSSVLTLRFTWTNKNTSVKSFENYVRNYLKNFSSFRRAYKIKSLDLIDM